MEAGSRDSLDLCADECPVFIPMYQRQFIATALSAVPFSHLYPVLGLPPFVSLGPLGLLDAGQLDSLVDLSLSFE